MTFHEVFAYTGQLSALYVEDNEVLRVSTQELLQNYFKKLDVAKNGREGLEHYKKSLELHAYDIVIADINMPYMDGIEMVREMRRLCDEQAVLFLSAHNEKDYLLEAIRLGVNSYLMKPLDLEELGKVLFQSAKSIVNQRKVEEQMLQEQKRNRLVEHYQKALMEWANIDFEDTENSLKKATELSAKTLNIGRVSIWLFNEEGTAIVCKDLYSLNEDEHSSGFVLEKDDFPRYFKALEERRVIVMDETRKDLPASEFMEEYLEPLGIYSMLDIPLLQEGKLLGVVCHESLDKVHNWCFEEQEFAMSLSNNIVLSLEIDKRYEMQKKLDYQAHHDELTGLPNRTLFLDRLEHAIQQNRRNKRQIALLFIDLDHFKEINDSFGHDTGDDVLKILTRRLSEHIREGDSLARLGGDEFTLILDNIVDTKVIVDIIQKLFLCTKEAISVDDQELYVTLSIGISIYPNDGESVEALLKHADAAMYKAKGEGRNTYQYYTQEMTEKAVERVFIETGLRQAIEKEEFEVYYQPQHNGIDDSLIGMEALIRWNREKDGLILPDTFIPIAVETGLVVEIDRWVMETAIKQFVRWYEEGLKPGRLSLNLTMRQLMQGDFIPFVKSVLQKYGYRGNWIEIELTEGRIMNDPEAVIERLEEIKKMGFTLAVDDFGTAYSSLSYLKRLPIDTLKIDSAFIKNLSDEEDEAISKAIIALGKSLDLTIIAEGVETEEQKKFLIEEGCHLMQGYYYDHPLPVKQMYERLKNRSEVQ